MVHGTGGQRGAGLIDWWVRTWAKYGGVVAPEAFGSVTDPAANGGQGGHAMSEVAVLDEAAYCGSEA